MNQDAEDDYFDDSDQEYRCRARITRSPHPHPPLSRLYLHPPRQPLKYPLCPPALVAPAPPTHTFGNNACVRLRCAGKRESRGCFRRVTVAPIRPWTSHRPYSWKNGRGADLRWPGPFGRWSECASGTSCRASVRVEQAVQRSEHHETRLTERDE